MDKEGKEVKLKPDELLLPTGAHDELGNAIMGVRKILPTKVRYMQGNQEFLGYQIMSKIGVAETFCYPDGYEVIENFLVSVFDDVLYVASIIDDLDIKMVNDILNVARIVNGIKEDEEEAKNAEMGEQGGLQSKGE
jgi:hypothetical protein